MFEQTALLATLDTYEFFYKTDYCCDLPKNVDISNSVSSCVLAVGIKSADSTIQHCIDLK
jgi:hypothetical protein